MNELSILYVIILMVVCFLAGFFLGIIYCENDVNERHRLWRDYLKERKCDEKCNWHH
jgi:uncharacterized protein YneF (UPF0154 family)